MSTDILASSLKMPTGSLRADQNLFPAAKPDE